VAVPAAGTARFEDFFEANHARLFSALCLITGNRAEAEEVMQEAFLAVWERWERVRAMESPVGYLYRTAMNLFRKRVRRAGLAVRRAVRVAPARSDDFEAVEDRAVVLRGLRTLRPDQRAALVLTSLRGFTSEETAEMMGTTAANVRMLASRGRAAIREAVGVSG